MLTIMTTSMDKQIVTNGNENSYETTMSQSSSSLYLPEDADAQSMKKEYKNGVLKVSFLKHNKIIK